ncbi:potassium channel family protein [Mycoplasma aquilae ATCC BAA-1896]|uniref:potassium channel family protein n=1 Tax=Mycoplasma aquilae TaxID=1312741 RepID=UPI003A874C3B
METIKLNLENKNTIFKIISLMTWSNSKIPSSLAKEKKKIKLITYLYAGIISFACFVSFLSLIQVPVEKLTSWGHFLATMQIITFFVFIIDYGLHMITYRLHYPELKLPMWKACLKYIFSFTGIIILFCILASFNAVEYMLPTNQQGNYKDSGAAKFFSDIKSLTIFKMIRFFFVLTLFAPFHIIAEVFNQQRRVLTYVFILIIIMIILFALIIWNNEANYLREQQIQYIATQRELKGSALYTWYQQNSSLAPLANKTGDDLNLAIYKYFTELKNTNDLATANLQASIAALGNGYATNFWNAIYFTTITLTTIGYGDFVPHAPVTKGIVTFISLVSIAIIAIPSGLIAGSFLNEMQKHFKNNDENVHVKAKEKLSEIKEDVKEALAEANAKEIIVKPIKKVKEKTSADTQEKAVEKTENNDKNNNDQADQNKGDKLWNL